MSKEKTSFQKKLYCEMLRIRWVEEKLIELFNSGHIKAPVHLSVGQEAVAVGVAAALRPQDKVVSTHRCHAHYLAKGGSLNKMMAELLGKNTGCSFGRGGTMHLFDDKAGLTISVPIVGASISFAVGIALASKIKGEDKIIAVFFGDGAVEEGIFWESINFASVHQLPVLFVCENNLYATHSHILKRQPNEDIFLRVRPHGFICQKIDGNDVMEVFQASESIIFSMKKLHKPGFIEARTYRIKEHWGPGEDWHLGYRSELEGAYWKVRCPIKLHKGISGMDELELKAAEDKIQAEIDEATRFAFESPEPTFKDLCGDRE